MAASQKPEPGTRLTRQQIRDEMRTVAPGVVPDRVKQHLAEVKAVNTMAAEIASATWGKGMTPDMRRSLAEYCRQRQLDVTEIDVLGGNIYRNARYYLRRLSEMIDAGMIEYVKADLVHDDPRLAKLMQDGGEDGEWARSEKVRRARERIEHGIPEAAAGACVFRVKLRSVPVEFTAAKWCGNGTKKNDPVGEQFPIETATSRAARRAMRYVASQIPGIRTVEQELDDSGLQVTDALREAHRDQLVREVPAPSEATPIRSIGAGDGYEMPTDQRVPVEAKQADPYAGEQEPDYSNAPSIDELPLDDRRSRNRNAQLED